MNLFHVQLNTDGLWSTRRHKQLKIAVTNMEQQCLWPIYMLINPIVNIVLNHNTVQLVILSPVNTKLNFKIIKILKRF